MSIKQQITVGFTLLVATLLLLFSLYIYRTYEAYRESLMQSRLQRRALAAQLYLSNQTEYRRTVYLTLPEQKLMLYTGGNQRLFASSGPDDYVVTEKILQKARKQEVYFSYNTPHWGDPKEGVALSFRHAGKQYVAIVTAFDLAGRHTNDNLRFILLMGNVLSLLVIGVAGFFFARRAMKPFDGLIHQLDTNTVNDFSFRLRNSDKPDESGYLAQSFNQMLGRLEQLANSQENFVAYASHEIRTPLTVVKGILETSRSYDHTLEDARQSIETALVRLEGAIDLANALLQLAEVEGLKATRLQEDINVVDTILDTVTYFNEKYPDQDIEVQLTDEFTEQSSRIRVVGNATLLRTVLINILDNACKYSGFAPVLLTVRYEAHTVLIDIQDQGIGIPDDQVADVFMPMMRADNVGNIKGFGLGLTLAKRIMDMHQGELRILRNQPAGTSVTLLLPALPFA